MRADSTAMRDEQGASLVIALIFVVATALVVVALVNLTGTNLINTANLQNERSVEYAADGVVEGAIQVVRPLNLSSTNSTCSGSTPVFAPASAINGVSLVAFCGNVAAPSFQRTVTFDACPSTNSFATCQNTALLEAQVTFIDISCTNNPSGCPSSGFTMTVDYWTVKRANA